MDFRVLEEILDLGQKPAVREAKDVNNKQFIFDNWRTITFICVSHLSLTITPAIKEKLLI